MLESPTDSLCAEFLWGFQLKVEGKPVKLILLLRTASQFTMTEYFASFVSQTNPSSYSVGYEL